METGLVKVEQPIAEALALELVPLIQRAEAQRLSARSKNTEKAYASDWRDWSAWCGERGFPALPAESPTVRLYLADRSERLKVSTLERRLIAIRVAHRQAGQPDPTAHVAVLAQWKGIRRQLRTRQKEAPALTTAHMRKIATTQPAGLLGARDRALLLLGFFGAFRRSELVALDVAAVRFEARGAYVTVEKSKTDQEGEGLGKVIPLGKPGTCPVKALREWIRLAGVTEGPLFRRVDRHGNLLEGRLSDKAVDRAVKRAAARAGLEDPERFSGHSLRAGFVTSAAAAGARDTAIMRQTGHRTHAMIAKYTREESAWADPAAALLGL